MRKPTNFITRRNGNEWGVYAAHPDKGTPFGVAISVHVTEASANEKANELCGARRRRPAIPATVFVRCQSHRARKRLFAHLGREPQAYYSFYDGCTGGFYQIERHEIEAARRAGATVVREPVNFHPCWA